MKISRTINVPSTALPHVRYAAAIVCWGADMSRFLEFPLRDFARASVTCDSPVLDGPVIKSAGIPSPRCKRSP